MPDSSINETNRPTVSIVLPTYNREKFLPDAFAAIAAQTFSDWELIVVDDGSTDNTREAVPRLTSEFSQPVHYIYQENQGAYGARNTALDRAQGKYVAFYDSDDLWLPHHLEDCVAAMEANPDVEWVYGACRAVELETGRVLKEHNFYPDGKPRPFLSLRTRTSGNLRIIDDPRATEVAIRHGLYSGPQNSVCRRSVFESLRFPPFKPVEDQLLVVVAVKSGVTFGYLDNVHVIYHVHAENASSAMSKGPLEKHLGVIQSLIDGHEWIRRSVELSPRELRSLNRQTARAYFWLQGYPLFQRGRLEQALAAFRAGLKLWPTNLWFWKTYLRARWMPHAGSELPVNANQAT